MMVFLLIFYWSAMDGHSKREVNNVRFLAKWSRDILLDLLTQYLYFKMLRKMSSLCVQNFDSAPSSMPKL